MQLSHGERAFQAIQRILNANRTKSPLEVALAKARQQQRQALANRAKGFKPAQGGKNSDLK